MATPQVKDLVLRSPAGSSEVITFPWPLQVGTGQDRHDNGIDIIDTIKFVCDELPSISSAFEEINLNKIDTACYKTMTNLVDRFNKAVDSLVALEKGTSLPTERLNKFAHPSLLRHILQLVYNAAVLDPEKLNIYEPFSPEVYGETSYELVQQIIKNVNVNNDDMFIDLGSGVGQVVLQMAGSFPLKSCIGIEKNETPALYAERMDLFFRQFMAWFGKRYCEYKLIRGDFLIDEHREKITTSSLVFVNNFAFGPNLDHQLKERFADLKDGARVVSSKSFCPLNFRITDRNLSDIGTIMHVSEIPPLVGSVSWTCKPVSYYLHVIDRTKLERYFQRLKTQKGADNDNHLGGSTRTTRDRAKREANNQTLNHSNNSNLSLSNNITNRTCSPAINVNVNGTSKTRQQQQIQIQNSLDVMDTSTESDNETNGNSNGSGGPTAFKSWSDWGSSKGKSSQSDEEENNNFIARTPTNVSSTNRTVTQRKRKKLARKVAIANKSAAAAAQREITAKERADSLLINNKNHHLCRDDNSGGGNSTGGGTSSATGVKGRKGRMKKGARGRKSLKIVGLDVLHHETILSTSVEAMSKKKPAAPGTVDQQLTSLLTENMAHTELDIPAAPQDTPYALQILLDVFRSQYMSMIEQMKAKTFVPSIKRQIQLEQERKQRIKNRASQLDKQIKVLIDDSVALLKVRMNELGINVSSPNDLIVKAKEIVGRHKELQGIAKKIQSQVTTCELEQRKLLSRHLSKLPAYQRLCGAGINGKIKMPNDLELSEAVAHEMVLKEIANTLSQRKRLKDQVLIIENETSVLEKSAEEKRTAALLIAQGTNITLANSNVLENHNHLHHHQYQSSALLTTATTSAPNLNEPLQLKINNSTSSSVNQSSTIAATITAKQDSPCIVTSSMMPNCGPLMTTVISNKNNNTSSNCRASRRNKDHRTRSQEWPDVPEMGKIQESNPEILAQKILETGRKIEAGKYNMGKQHQPNVQINNNHQHLHYNNHHQHHQDTSAQQTEEKPSYRVHHHHHQQQQSQPQPSLKHHYHHRLSVSEHQTSDINYRNNQDVSSLMPAPSKHRDIDVHLTHSQNISSSVQPSKSVNLLHVKQTGGIMIKSELLTGVRKNTSQTAASLGIQESPKVANFEDRLKSIITSALNEDQEHRKAQQQMHPLHVDINESTTPQQSPVSKRGKHMAGANISNLASLHNTIPSVSNSNSSSLSNIISVATNNVTHLNSTTTISPITLPSSTHVNNPGGTGIGNSVMYCGGKYVNDKSMIKQQNVNTNIGPSLMNTPIKSGKYYQHVTATNNDTYPNMGHSSDMARHRRRNSVNATSYEQFIAVQQQQHHDHHHQNEQTVAMQSHHNQGNNNNYHHHHHHNHQPSSINTNAGNMTVINQYQHLQHHATNSPQHPISLEFKAPSISGSENQQLTHQRSSNRESLTEESTRINSSNIETPLIHYRDRLISLERSSSRDSIQVLSQSTSHQPPSRPSSNSSQPDYTQVSPAKMALRRHLSQEKLNQQLPPGSTINGAIPMSTKTIGDLVNGEIERTLEEGIKLQSIINAAVNMSSLGNATSERPNVHLKDSNVFSNERERAERLIINPNVQRPERVHVRVVDDHHHTNPIDNISRSTSCTVSLTERKSPYANNLATLAHVAYQHKNIDATDDKINTQHRQYNNNLRERAINDSSNEFYHSHPSPPAVGKLSGTSSNLPNVKTVNATINSGSREYQPVALPRAEIKPCIEAYFQEKQQHLQNHLHTNLHSNHAHKIHTTGNNNNTINSKDGHHRMGNSRCNRLNGNNPPLEGLAASLQDRMMASRKFKEEHEERQRRAAAASTNMISNNATTMTNNEHSRHASLNGINNDSREHYNPVNYGIASQTSLTSKRNNNSNHSATSCVKVEVGTKRTSPMASVNHTIRPAKVPHYLHETTTKTGIAYGNTNGVTLNHHHHTQHQPLHISSEMNDNHRAATTNNIADSLLINSDMVSAMSSNEQQHHLHTVTDSRSNMLHHNDTNMPQQLYGHHLHQHNARHHNHQQHQQHHHHNHHSPQLQTQAQHLSVAAAAAASASTLSTSTTSTQSPLTAVNSCAVNNSLINTAGRSADDDDVTADDETHWQHRVSSGFDRLVAFASTELDKTRRSIDADTIPSSISCNTSPDSGITHSSSNSEASRTFLSTSSTSSQLEMPISSGSSSSSSGNGSFLGHHPIGSTDHLSDSSMKSENASLPITLKASSSPIDTTAMESPPLSDMGLPRTPSPNVNLNTITTPTPPPLPQPPQPPQPPSSSISNLNNSQVDKTVPINNLKIPLKYQRKSKSSSEKHYKKKFCERNWEYDCDEIMAYSNSSSNIAADVTNTTVAINGKAATIDHTERSKQSTDASATAATTITTTLSSPSSSLGQQIQHHHKSSKFRPKGKDWDWSLESNYNSSNSIIHNNNNNNNNNNNKHSNIGNSQKPANSSKTISSN